MSETAFLVAVVPESEFAPLAGALHAAGVTARRVEGLADSAVCHAVRPDVILCDADWLDWREALQTAQGLEIPVVFLSVLADERMWVAMLQAGAFDLLRKPCLPKELCWAIAGAVGRVRPREQAAHAA